MRVLVITAMWPTKEDPAFGSFVRSQFEALQQEGVDLRLLVLKGPIRKLIYPLGVLQMVRILATDSIDLVHAHYGFAGVVARMQWQVPVVVSFCGDDLLGTPDATGHRSVGSLFLAWVCRSLSNYVDEVIVKSDEMATKLKRRDVHVIPNEINTQVFRVVPRTIARKSLGLDPEKKYLLFAANPAVPRKRFDLAKAVATELKRNDPSVELLVVCRETQAQLALYMNACDALIFPSNQEGSPNVVKQAMACNLPIVASAVGSIPQILAGTEHCYVCPPDAASYTAALTEILRERPRSDGNARVQHLSPSIVARQVIDVYEMALQTHGSRNRTTQQLAAK